LWDETNQALFAARDRFGIKPLYYAVHDGTLFLASEIKALFAAGVPRIGPPVTLRPTERFHQMLQDTLRGPVLGSMPFYDQKKIIARLDELPAMTDAERIGWDPVLMSVLSACVIQQRFGLGSKATETGNFAFRTSRTGIRRGRRRLGFDFGQPVGH
jgi:hypothetical protein